MCSWFVLFIKNEMFLDPPLSWNPGFNHCEMTMWVIFLTVFNMLCRPQWEFLSCSCTMFLYIHQTGFRKWASKWDIDILWGCCDCKLGVPMTVTCVFPINAKISFGYLWKLMKDKDILYRVPITNLQVSNQEINILLVFMKDKDILYKLHITCSLWISIKTYIL